ncbi:hypothetical protein PFISCL1PPCAC_6822, partial [Pristionchus fissidentatus]
CGAEQHRSARTVDRAPLRELRWVRRLARTRTICSWAAVDTQCLVTTPSTTFTGRWTASAAWDRAARRCRRLMVATGLPYSGRAIPRGSGDSVSLLFFFCK